MKINTKFFGEIEISDEQVILFPYGIYGFESCGRFVLLHDIEYQEENDTVFRFLQSVDDETLCFTVIDPKYVIRNYKPKLPNEYIKKLNINSETAENDLVYLAISLISENVIEDSTANMQGPLVINSKNRLGAQVILESSEPENSEYKIRHKIFEGYNDYYDDSNFKEEECEVSSLC